MHLWSTKPEYGQTVTGVQDGVIVAPNQGLSAPAAGPEAVGGLTLGSFMLNTSP